MTMPAAAMGPLRGALLVLGLTAALALPGAANAQATATHDFDFEIGSWTVANARLMHRPDGTREWIHFRGTSIARPVWNGQGDVVELESDAPYGHTRALIIRLFDPRTRDWRTTFASADDGVVGPPLVGTFTSGRAELLGVDSVDGKPMRIRHVLSHITAISYRLEQSVSVDGGQTWELNWISDHTRTKP